MNERNVRIQQMLKAEGLYKGKLDGIIGPVTRRALELHNKAQYQPLPPERPGPPQDLQGSVATGVGDPGAMAQLQMDPAAQASVDRLPMPDSSAEIQNPSMGTATPASGEWIRAALNAVLGPQAVQPPPRPPSYQPNFAGEADYPPNFDKTFAPGPQPADNGALLGALQQSLGQILSRR